MAIVDPTDIANLRMWCDASNVTLNGNKIITMDNRETTAAYDLTQATDSQRPIQVNVKGLSGAQFDGIDDVLYNVGPVDQDIQGTLTMTLTLPPTPSGIESFIIGDHDSQPGTRIVLYGLSNEIRAGRSFYSGHAVQAAPDVDWAWGDKVIITLTWDGATDACVLRIAKVQKDSGVGSDFLYSEGWALGARRNASNPADIIVFGITTYSRILTATEIDDIEQYHDDNYLTPANDPPVADAGPDQTVRAEDDFNAAVTLDGSASTDDVGITNYNWTDGPFVELADGAGEVTPDVNLAEGVHNITLEVSDAGAETDTDTVDVTVLPKIRTYKQFTNSTATEFQFNDIFSLFAATIEPYYNQLRIFKKVVAGTVTELFPVGRPDSSGDTQLTINSDGTGITLDTALIATDILVIMRETRMDRAFATLEGSSGASYLRAFERNLRGDQILFLCQELRELRDIADILGSGSGETFEYNPGGDPDVGLFSVEHEGDGSTTDFSYEDITMLPPEAGLAEDPALTVTVGGNPVAFTAAEATDLVTITPTPPDGSIVHIERKTRIHERWVEHKDGTTLSSIIEEWDRLHIQFMVEETPDFPDFLAANFLTNRIFPRRVNVLTYSGPGERFSFANIPWFGGGELFFFIDNVPVPNTSYTIDFIHWEVVVSVATGETLTIEATNPEHAFHALPFGFHQSQAEDDETAADEDTIFEVVGTFEVLRKKVLTDDSITTHNAVEIGEVTGGIGDEKGAILFLTATDLGDDFPGADVLDADITVIREANTLTASNAIDPTDADPRGDGTWAAVDARILTVVGAVPVIPIGLGQITLDATDVFQEVADENFATDVAYFVAHEEPLPADAASGSLLLNGVVKYRVRYKLGTTTPSETTITPTSQEGVMVQQDEADTHQGATPWEAKTVWFEAVGTADNRRAVLLTFDISALSAPVTSARLKFDTARFKHAVGLDADPTVSDIRFAWLDDATGLQGSTTSTIPQATWNHMRTASADPGPETKWVAIVTNGDDADEGGGTDAEDHDEATLVSVMWPGQPFSTVDITNWQVFGLKAMVDAALTAGKTELDLAMFIGEFVGQQSAQQVELRFWPSIFQPSGRGGVSLIVEP